MWTPEGKPSSGDQTWLALFYTNIAEVDSGIL